MPTFGSLFSGIGGLDLGLERAGWTGRWQVEVDDFCTRVLARHWPDVPRYGDIYGVDFRDLERVDLIVGGFPCQPFSNAGRRAGKADERWLWPEFARAVRVLRPCYVLVENVAGLLAGHGGMGDVLGDLAALGYDAEWDSLPASAVGAPHLRYRVFVVAYRTELGRPVADPDDPRTGDEVRAGRDAVGHGGPAATGPVVAHPDRLRPGRPSALGPPSRPRLRPEHPGPQPHGAGPRTDAGPGLFDALPDPDGARPQGHAGDGHAPDEPPTGADRPTRPAGVFDGADRSGWWAAEPDVGRVAHGVPARVDRLRALGNAVVPQIAEEIGRRLLVAEGLV